MIVDRSGRPVATAEFCKNCCICGDNVTDCECVNAGSNGASNDISLISESLQKQ